MLHCYISCFFCYITQIFYDVPEKGVIRQQKGVMRQQKGVILVVVYSKRWYMLGNLIPAGLDGLVAMDRRHQHHQHIRSGVLLVLPGSGILDATWKSKKKQVEVIHSSGNHCGQLKKISHSGPAEKKITQNGQAKKSEETVHMPRAYRCFWNVCKKAGTVATVFFVPPVESVSIFEHVVASFASVFWSKEVANVL